MVGVPEWLMKAVVAWVDRTPLPELARLATAEAPVAQQLANEYPPWMRRFARGYLGPEGVAALRAAGPSTWAAVVDYLCSARPDAGLWIMAHEDWFYRELSRARDLFLAD